MSAACISRRNAELPKNSSVWRGDDVERAKFEKSYDAAHAAIIVADGEDAGWMTVLRGEHIELDSLYPKPSMQGCGLGTSLVKGLISEAETIGKPYA